MGSSASLPRPPRAMTTSSPIRPRPHREAAGVLQEREDDLTRLTEDVARLSARHQSAHRLLSDSRKTLQRSEAEAARARAAVERGAGRGAECGHGDGRGRGEGRSAPQRYGDRGRRTCSPRPKPRGPTPRRARRMPAPNAPKPRARPNALRAEVSALARLLDRDTAEGGQILDRLQVQQGYEKALGAALADDLRAPQVEAGRPLRAGPILPAYDVRSLCPTGVTALSAACLGARCAGRGG